MVEMFKRKSNLNPTFMENIFTKTEVKCNLRSKNHLQLPNINTAKYGIKNVHHLWASLPEEDEDSDTLTNFKQKIKSWKGSTCICRLCKVFVNGKGCLYYFSFSLQESCPIFLSFILLTLINYLAIFMLVCEH